MNGDYKDEDDRLRRILLHELYNLSQNILS